MSLPQGLNMGIGSLPLLSAAQNDARERLPRSPSFYVLPPNVTVSDEDKNRTITFELVERPKAE